MFKTEFIKKLRETSQSLEATASDLVELSNILEVEELADQEDVVEFLRDWCKHFSVNLSFDDDREIIVMNYVPMSYIDVEDTADD